MNKAFVKESSEENDDDLDVAQPAIPAGAKNYITPAGYRRLRDELLHLLDKRTDLNAAVLDRFREELKFTHAAKLSDIEMSEEVLEQIGFFV